MLFNILKLIPEEVEQVILDQLDRVNLGHKTFTADALNLSVRSADGILRRARNLCLESMLEAVRTGTKSIDLKIVNKVLIQPH